MPGYQPPHSLGYSAWTMETSVQKISDVEYDLEITATADDLAEDLTKAIRQQRGQTTLKGFRPGHVPLSVVKRIYGKSLAYGIAEQHVQKTYESEIMGDDTYHVLGQPTITDLSYEYEGDLRAVVRFGVRPEFDLADLSKETVFKLVHEVDEAEVEKEIEQLRISRAELIPEDGPADLDSVISADMQRLDLESTSPIVGEKQENVPFALSDENLMPQIKEALIGKVATDVAIVTLPGRDEDPDDRLYEITVKEVKRRELPELNEELVSDLTNEKVTDVDTFRDEVRTQIENGWEQRGREWYESDLIGRLVELHDIPLPESVVDMYLESYVKELKEKQGDKLPEAFNEGEYREYRRAEAENQARWMFIRDKIMAEQKFEITEEERDVYLEKTAGPELPLETLKQYYEAVPNMMEQLDQRLLSELIFEWIESQLTIEEKDLDAYREATKQDDAEHDHDHS